MDGLYYQMLWKGQIITRRQIMSTIPPSGSEIDMEVVYYQNNHKVCYTLAFHKF